jgi:hypothetical protein
LLIDDITTSVNRAGNQFLSGLIRLSLAIHFTSNACEKTKTVAKLTDKREDWTAEEKSSLNNTPAFSGTVGS